ncbi:MAG: cysteinyl-tRNA synthetase [Cellvibrionaceae bacterium]|jgi:cysteinyl-tRNA synthetase
MTLSIYNTLSRTKQKFIPLEPGKISLYVCGMTVYDYCHIGHARVMVAFDVITRFLRTEGWKVNYVRNITDIDDKILNRARENNEEFTDLTARFINAMHEDEAKLNVLSPDHQPKATAYINEIINMISILVDQGYAYQTIQGDVYYRVSRFVNYGKLSGKNPDELLSGVRIDLDQEKEDPRDFALWKASSSDDAHWDSPWGKGRPGWHIECSAMCKSCLGSTFDIHGGGPDLPFPHHENEIAQSEAANGCHFVNYWIHVGAVRVDGHKMSKSKNNFFTIRDVLKKYHPEVIRYLIISSHYRSEIHYSEENLVEAKSGLDRFYHTLKNLDHIEKAKIEDVKDSEYYRRFSEAMNDDFNTRVALAVMHDLIKNINSLTKTSQAVRDRVAQLKLMASTLGILQNSSTKYLQGKPGSSKISVHDIETMIIERQQAKNAKNFSRADEIRSQLASEGIIVEDSRGGTSWRKDNN